MRIAFISDWYAENMGYSENFLPRAMARLGHDVHLVTSNGKPYFTSFMYSDVYESVFGPPLIECYERYIDGVYVHRLPHRVIAGHVWINGLYQILKKISPDVVQVFEITPLTTWFAAKWREQLGYNLYAESRLHASVFYLMSQNSRRFSSGPIKRLSFRVVSMQAVLKRMMEHGLASFMQKVWRFPITRTIRLGQNWFQEFLISNMIMCFPLSEDVFDILLNHFHWPPEKLEICPLGVDTDLFRPLGNTNEEKIRLQVRNSLGFSDEHIVCIYTGRFTDGKDPLCLGLAIDELVKGGQPFRGLFVGNGSYEYIQRLKKCRGCIVHPFRPVEKLRDLYVASDIGVWPREESTSQLDAMACGLPLVLNDKVRAKERIEGNALTFRNGNYRDLSIRLKMLAEPDERKRMGSIGAKRVKDELSWDIIAKRRVDRYQQTNMSTQNSCRENW